MSIPKTVYVKAMSKKQLNLDLAERAPVVFEEYRLMDTNAYSIDELPNGTIVKIYRVVIDGSPYARSYGVVKDGKVK